MRWAKVLSLGLLTGLAMVFALEPSLAGNKFEVISSGVEGVYKIKREHLKLAMFACSGLLFLMMALTLIVPHRNPLLMNHLNWRRSAVMLGIGATVVFVGALLV